MTWLVKAKKNGTVRRERQTPVIRGLVITFEMIPPDWKRMVIVMIMTIKAAGDDDDDAYQVSGTWRESPGLPQEVMRRRAREGGG